MPEHALDHGHPDDGKHLLGRGERERAKPRSLAAHEDNRLHYLVVVVDEGLVVVVAGTDEVVVDAGTDEVVVDEAGAVVVVAGTVLAVVPAAVVVVVATGA
jgi:hypothetical protein